MTSFQPAIPSLVGKAETLPEPLPAYRPRLLYADGLQPYSSLKHLEKYCTEECVQTFFHPDNVNGIEKAELVTMDINPLEYAKSSNDFNVLVTVRFTAAKDSVFYDGTNNPQTTSFYIHLLRQADGNYLINDFFTG